MHALMNCAMKHRLLFVFLLCFAATQAQIPSGYYSGAYNKKGYALRVALHNIIKNHTALSYSDLWGAYYTTDVRPDNGKVWDVYSDVPNGTPSYYFTFGSDQCGNYSGEGDCYNREHVIPQSWFGDALPMKTDLFHVYPTDGWVNNKRGNMAYGEVNNVNWTSSNGSKIGSCATPGYSGNVFEPIDAYKGDLARSFLYMSVCYMDKNLGKMSESMYTNGTLDAWALNMFVRWHNEDPVSQKEIDRNNAVYSIQHNRNPFIDHPELVGKIFGNDSVNAFNPTGVEDYDLSNQWVVYPNPANDLVTIAPPARMDEVATLQVVNLTGHVLIQENISLSDCYKLNVADLKPGLYLIRIQSDKFCVLKKIIKS